ncbi:hypothetical protein CYJ74_05775 [Klebsiella pneumoniae]|nr:hypothetical protein A9F10_08360 [Klebsiella pneumoniae]HBX1683509.1 hypothetical protein [Klebsiella pneumoniae subsp. pneumoniae]PLA17175.1 hypothetical protein CYJ74_05775 [Klebsiella pneumoniae]PLL04785.1 hypothetical protein CWN20_10465 [Klebsiella pneumoniae]PLL33297.1 hypothetical protein CWN30_16810 [Klebsiella pneumoniae]
MKDLPGHRSPKYTEFSFFIPMLIIGFMLFLSIIPFYKGVEQCVRYFVYASYSQAKDILMIFSVCCKYMQDWLTGSQARNSINC